VAISVSSVADASKTTVARVDRAALEPPRRDAGLDAALLPEEPTADRALKQAVREAQSVSGTG
jgi:hypothetical protein